MDTNSKHPYGIFVPEIWEVIAFNLHVNDTFQLARTSKAMWEHVRHIPFEGTWNIYSSAPVTHSFLLANVKHVRVSIKDNINYENLSRRLNSFYILQSIDFTGKALIFEEVTVQAAKKMLLCVPNKRATTITVFVRAENRVVFEEARKTIGRRIELRSVAKRKKMDEDEDDQDDEEDEIERRIRRARTPSPLRDDVEVLKERIAKMKEAYIRYSDDPVSALPLCLQKICQSQQFADVTTAWNDAVVATTRDEADDFVNQFCASIVESIAISSKGSWIYITQAEAYMRRARNIDDCANTTITINHPAKAQLVIEQKREYQNQWHEAKVYFQNFEFLVTGCLCGTDSNDDVNAVLGASLGNYAAAEDYWRMYVPKEPVPVVRECRLLRNFTKAASGFQWLLKSRRFQESGFGTACAIALHELEGVDSIVAIGSLLLSWKALDQKDKQKLRSMLSGVNELRELDLSATVESIKKVRELEMAKGKKLAAEVALLELNDESVKDLVYVEMFKALISPRLKVLNNQAVRQKKYLLQ